MPSCPFCNIASTYPPHPPSSPPSPLAPADTSTSSQAHLILSTKHVLAFLDIMPLSKGHVLVTTREHAEKLGDLGVRVSREVGQWLPILSRAVMKTLFGDHVDAHWNVVQNNGIRAAQVVPHVHFHIVPRPALDTAPQSGKMSYVMFGRGPREEIDDEEGDTLARAIREEVAREVRRVKEVEGVDLDGGVDGVRGRL